MIIKVCGMREPQNIREVAALAINWIGFIFYERSKRFVERCPTEQQATDSEQLSPKKVGVFVNATIESMMEKASTYKLDYLQLHGNESPEDCHTLQKRGYSLIKAFPIATKEDFEKTREYEGRVDYFLFDTRCEGYGGSGKQSETTLDLTSELFQGLPKTVPVARYHSLAADEATLPETLKVTARTADGEVMAVEDSEKKIYGVQFHPESILTPQGRQMVENFLKITR